MHLLAGLAGVPVSGAGLAGVPVSGAGLAGVPVSGAGLAGVAVVVLWKFPDSLLKLNF